MSKLNIIKNIFVWHPYFFALLPVFFLYSNNYKEYPLAVVLTPSVILSAFTCLSLIILNMLFHDKEKTAVFFSFFIIIFFMFGPLYSIFCLDGENIKILRFRYFFVLYFFVCMAILYVFIKKKFNFKKFSYLLNLTSLFISILIFSNLLRPLTLPIGQKAQFEKDKIVSKIDNRFLDTKKDNYLHDIYFIVLDSYPSFKNLKEILGFENDDFMKFLKDRGFFIIEDSSSNYNYTRFSISSTFNLDYINTEKIGDNTYSLKDNDFDLMKLQNSKAISFLSSFGYNILIESPLFNRKYLEMVFFNHVLMMSVMISPYIQNFVNASLIRGCVLSTFNFLEKHVNFKSPFFVYAHIMLPHVPYMFDKKGNMPSFFKQKDEKKMFIEQLIYTNERMKKIIDSILLISKKRPIIIIQSDHGPDLKLNDKEKVIKIRTGILNAVFLPDRKGELFYNEMTPVNTFRLVFNRYFNANFERLPDITYYQEKESGKLAIYKKINSCYR